MDWEGTTEPDIIKTTQGVGVNVHELLDAPSRNIGKEELLKIINDYLGINGRVIIASVAGQGPTTILPALERIVVLGI